MHSFVSPLSSEISRRPILILARAHEAGSLPVLLFVLFSNALFLSLSLYHRAFLFRLFLLSFLVCSYGRSEIEKWIMQRNVSRKDTLFFSARLEKKERDVSFSLRSSLFFLSSLFFKSVKSVKDAAPGEREPRANELLPSSYSPHHRHLCCVRKRHHRKDDEREDVIYILTYIHR